MRGEIINRCSHLHSASFPGVLLPNVSMHGTAGSNTRADLPAGAAKFLW